MKNILYIVWSDNNKIGIPIIDEQHRGIISTINSLHYFIQTGHGHEIIKPTMIMLEQYTYVHFKTEEALMAEASYPAFEEHIVLHKALLKKTKDLSIDANRNKDSDMVLKFLKEWWLGHINKEDKKYTPFLRKLIDTKAF
ncbi:MAG: hemerythrin family protein [Spirochaetales bacterium]|jgi:hemerythrin|nr:hemerythrin family protein [Spirochaetales bacterium]